MGFENWKEKLELATDHLDNWKYCVFSFFLHMDENSVSISLRKVWFYDFLYSSTIFLILFFT